MTHILHRQISFSPPLCSGGEGPYLIDDTGKRYLDASGGAAVSCLGHCDPDVIAAIKAQIKKLAFAHTGFFTSQPAEDLADFLIAAAPDGIGMIYFVSGGSEAVETALKMTRQYYLETGEPSRTRFIARRQSYHGNTLGALSVGGNVLRREPYKEMLMETSHIAPCYAYRDRLNDETEEAYGLRIADQLEVEILRLGSHNVAGFIAETVGGATAGVLPPVAGYFKRIREICNRYGVMMILDEVMCGMGRTGVLFACEKDGVAPDIICVAKGLGGGYQPIGAALLSQKIFDAFRNGSGVFQHGHTYMGHTTACAASLAVQRKIQDYDLLTNVRDQGVYLMDCLKQRFGNHTNVGDIRGRGLFVGIELVADRASKEPFDPTANVNGRIKMEAMDRGLICYPSGGTKDGVCGDHVLLAPPFIVNRDHIDELVDKLGGAVDAALRLAGV